MHTLNAFKEMGVEIKESEKLIIFGKGLNALKNQKIYLETQELVQDY